MIIRGLIETKDSQDVRQLVDATAKEYKTFFNLKLKSSYNEGWTNAKITSSNIKIIPDLLEILKENGYYDFQIYWE